jgi:tetratricopeptide (TPR) repeat protein
VAQGLAQEIAPTPAERRIAAARKLTAAQPARAQSHVELAAAFARRARETGRVEDYAQAAQAVQRALALDPDAVEARKTEIWILLGQHRFAEALAKAEALNARVPDDPTVYGLLADAYAELGRYDDAEKAVQWMLDLRPGTVAALTRAAYLRELFGDLDGAVELMETAHDRTPPTETEERAWILVQLAHLRRTQGKLALAEELAEQALRAFPTYHYALGELAAVRSAQGRHDEAVVLLRRRLAVSPHPEHLFALGVELTRAGRKREAGSAFAEFTQAARAESAAADNANRELILYLVDYARRPAEALEIARREITRRRDINTLDTYAWALSANGLHRQAKTVIDEALAVGTKDSAILEHARIIASRLAAPGDSAVR